MFDGYVLERGRAAPVVMWIRIRAVIIETSPWLPSTWRNCSTSKNLPRVVRGRNISLPGQSSVIHGGGIYFGHSSRATMQMRKNVAAKYCMRITSSYDGRHSGVAATA